ncbi:MAG TPA: SpoIID/LytB domain-containing protein [Acidimicrobiia bacterium]|nr:SpoIID/LytB domain-containing protein [Acidimicrobiia bacterium]
MPTGPRLLFAAFIAGALAAGPAAPAAQAAKGAGSGKKSSPTAAKASALTADVARFEPLPPGAAGAAPTLALERVGEYRGIIEIRRAGGGVGAVNEVALDDYLKGISEVPSSWPPEVLRAQAIAARTYLLWTLGNGANGAAAALDAQICATESCQVYSGVAKERAPNGDRWAAAVRDTSGLALLSGGSPILAKYSACNGGRSVSGGKPYLKVVDDPDDAKCPLHRWGLTVSYDDIGRALAVPGTVKSVRATSGDVVVRYSAESGDGEVTVPRTGFRAKVGAAVPPPPDRSRTVPSILFTLRPDDGARVATLDGRGFGHGIGMSQWGAYGKGLRGMKAAAILAAYYGGIQPAKVPASKLPSEVRVAVENGKAPAPKPPPGHAKPGVQAAGPAASGGKPGSKPGDQGAGRPPDAGGKPGAKPGAANSGPGGGKAGTAAGGAAKPKAQPPAGAADAVVSASGPFRILDSKGNVVVPVATGTWKVVPAGKGLRLVPPRDQAGAPGLTVLGIEPAAPLPGQPVTVRFKSNLPSILSATAQPPGAAAPAPVLSPEVSGTGERRLTLPAATQPGPYAVTLTADAGPGRTAALTITPAVLDPAGSLPSPTDAGAGPASARGLLGLPLEARVIEGGLTQTLIAVAAPAEAFGRAPVERASRSSSIRSAGSPGSPADPTTDNAGGVLLAALSGLALWRFRARRAPAPPSPDAGPPSPDAGPPGAVPLAPGVAPLAAAAVPPAPVTADPSPPSGPTPGAPPA